MNYPTRHKNACIEFNKLSTAKSLQKCVFELEADKNMNPPIGAYDPKFDYSTSFKVVGNIFLDKKKKTVSNKKRLKKLCLIIMYPVVFYCFNH